ncbi:MAG: PEGA domain-containing protein [Candidatus Levybacteria bacterium]|nr:PEGA domain-containing protein [Candidatus Levybacteria bacterium]
MKRALFILIPSFVLALAMFLIVQSVFFHGNDKGALQVTASPQSKVYLSGKYLGQTPLCKCNANDMLKIGEYTIKIVPMSGKSSEFQEKIKISKSILTVVDRKFGENATSEGSVITLQQASDGKRELLVTSIPDKAEVFLDNSSSGFTPLLLKDVTESDHELLLKKSGYSDKKIRVRTPSGYRLLARIYMGIHIGESLESLVSPTPVKVSSPSATPTPLLQQIIILQTPTGYLRVRQSNSVSSSEVGRVLPGKVFSILSEKEGWYQISLDDGIKGWVSGDYAKKQ